jgi:hypothetical protein
MSSTNNNDISSIARDMGELIISKMEGKAEKGVKFDVVYEIDGNDNFLVEQIVEVFTKMGKIHVKYTDLDHTMTYVIPDDKESQAFIVKDIIGRSLGNTDGYSHLEPDEFSISLQSSIQKGNGIERIIHNLYLHNTDPEPFKNRFLDWIRHVYPNIVVE